MSVRVRERRRQPWFGVDKPDLARLADRCEQRQLPYARSVYFAILELANDQRADEARATQAQVADRAGVSTATLKRCVTTLVDVGLIVVESGQLAGDANTWIVVTPDGGGGSSGATGWVHESRGVALTEPPLKETGQESSSRNLSSDDERVWHHYLEARKAWNPRSTGVKFSDAERKVIRDALKVRPLEDVLAAVAGLFKSSWHTDGGYLGIHYALKGGGRSPVPGATIDRFAAIEREQVRANGNGNGHAGVLHNVVFQDGRTYDELTTGEQLGVKEMMAMGMKPWEDEQPAPAPRTVSNGRTYTGDNICD